jgi:hypothetical protein
MAGFLLVGNREVHGIAPVRYDAAVGRTVTSVTRTLMPSDTAAQKGLVRIALAIILVFGLIAFFLKGPSEEGETTVEDDATGTSGPLVPIEAEPVATAKDAAYRHADGILYPNGERGETRVWSEARATDMNGDGTEDLLVVIEEAGADAPMTYYVASLVSTDGGFLGGVAYRVGQGIAIQNYRISQGEVQVNYADRRPWESDDARPSVGKTKRLSVDQHGILTEKAGEQPSADGLAEIVSAEWGTCEPVKCAVELADGTDGVWYVVATYKGLEDDSIAAERRFGSLVLGENGWTIGSTLYTDHACHEGRGHAEFSAELCI